MLKIIINLKIIYISLSVLSMILFYKLYYEKEKDIKSNWYDVNSSFTNLLLNWGPSYFFLQLRSRHSWTVFFNFFTFLSPQSFVHLRQKYFEQLTFKIFSTINILFGANSSRQTDSLSIHSLQTIEFFYEWKKKTDPRYFYPSVWLGNVFPREKSLNTSFPVQVSPYGDLRLQLLLACIYWSDGLVKVWLVSSNQSIFLLGKIICTINGETRANSVFWRFSRANEV